MSVSGKTFDELKVGDRFVFTSITLTEAHIVLFAGISGDFNPLHLSEEFARRGIFGGRVAHGMLTASIMSGAVGTLLAGTAMALLDVAFRFVAPVRIGDTIQTEAEVLEKRPSRKYRGGVVKLGVVCRNQRGERVVEGSMTILVSNERAFKPKQRET